MPVMMRPVHGAVEMRGMGATIAFEVITYSFALWSTAGTVPPLIGSRMEIHPIDITWSFTPAVSPSPRASPKAD
jgi:hypothetical protein